MAEDVAEKQMGFIYDHEQAAVLPSQVGDRDVELRPEARAPVVRGEPRDLYEIWLLSREDVEFDLKSVEHRPAPYDRE